MSCPGERVRVGWVELDTTSRRHVLRCWAVCYGCGRSWSADLALDSAAAQRVEVAESVEQSVLADLHAG